MRKIKTLLALLLFVMTSFCASAYDFSIDDIYYNIIDSSEKTVEVTSNDDSLYSGIVTIPSTVTYNGSTYRVISIGEGAFSFCYGLTSVTIGNSVTSIGDFAFSYCVGLTSVTIGNSVTSIGDNAFNSCYDLTSVTIPNSVISIGDNAFKFCAGLTSVTIGNSVTSIGYRAFRDCIQLQKIEVVSDNKNYASANGVLFTKDMKNLIQFPAGKTGMYEIPGSVTTIGNEAFYYCNGLTSVTIPNSVTTIGNYAFSGCTGLTSVNIPNSVIEIGKYAFYYCVQLTSVTISDSVIEIGDEAFSYCRELSSVTIPNSVTSIGSRTFIGCYILQEIEVASDNKHYASVDGVLFTKDMKNLIQFPAGKTGEYEIPNSVTSIGNFAFSDCSGLTSVTIPKSVTSIGNYAFSCCTGLTSVTIPNSVIEIGDCVFCACKGLTSITIPNSVTSIGNAAFEFCRGLTSFTIPTSVTSIGSFAFYRCDGLKSIYCHTSTPPSIESDTFYDCYSAVLHVPSGTADVYKNTEYWSNFETIIDDIMPEIDGVEDLRTEESNGEIDWSDAEYYNVQGVRVDKPTQGLYIQRKGGVSRKIIVR